MTEDSSTTQEAAQEPQKSPELKQYVEEPGTFYTDTLKSLYANSVKSIESAAIQIVTVNSVLIGIYFNAITQGGLKFPFKSLTVCLYASPIALWLISLLLCFTVFGPKRMQVYFFSDDDSKSQLEVIASKKHMYYKLSFITFLLGIVSLIVVLIHYLSKI